VQGFLIVFCTCASEEQADRLARSVVEKRLAACANILPPIQSVYWWQGQIEVAPERLLLFKTTEDRFAELRDAVIEMHSYAVPEIIAVPITAGSDPYLAWIRENV
jgi:periplasmic divalent cation tolerance protein